MMLDNFVSAERVGNSLIYHFSCTRCGADYIKSAISKNKGLCPMCKNAESKQRAKISNENYRQRAIKEVGADVKRLVRTVADKHTVYIHNIEYVDKNAVLDAIKDYFNQH